MFTVHVSLNCLLYLSSQRERGRTHRPWVPANERRWVYFCGIQVREGAPASRAPPPEPPFLTFNPGPAPTSGPDLSLTGPAALHSLPSSQTFQLITKSLKSIKDGMKCPQSDLLPQRSTRHLFSGLWDVLTTGVGQHVESLQEQDSSALRDSVFQRLNCDCYKRQNCFQALDLISNNKLVM